jgi:hypothetical protein
MGSVYLNLAHLKPAHPGLGHIRERPRGDSAIVALTLATIHAPHQIGLQNPRHTENRSDDSGTCPAR